MYITCTIYIASYPEVPEKEKKLWGAHVTPQVPLYPPKGHTTEGNLHCSNRFFEFIALEIQ